MKTRKEREKMVRFSPSEIEETVRSKTKSTNVLQTAMVSRFAQAAHRQMPSDESNLDER